MPPRNYRGDRRPIDAYRIIDPMAMFFPTAWAADEPAEAAPSPTPVRRAGRNLTRAERIAAGFPPLTGNLMRRYAMPDEPAPRHELRQTPFGLALHRNAKVVLGNYYHTRRLVELSTNFYDSGSYRLATDADVVLDYAGRPILKAHAATLTHGEHAGQYFCKGWGYECDRDRQVVNLNSSDPWVAHRYCLRSDDVVDTTEGTFLRGDRELEGMVEVQYTRDSRLLCHPSMVVRAIIDEHGAHGDAYRGNCSEYGPGENWCLGEPGLLEANGIGYSSQQGQWWLMDDEVCHDYTQRNSGYHGLRRRNFTNGATFTVGVEVEKEDAEQLKIPYGPLYHRMGWCKERDGSLNSYGYELVSPAYDLFSNQLDEALADPELEGLVNATFSRNCGGHINFGRVGYDGADLLDQVAGWLPLIYAMFPGRARGTHSRYAAARRKDELRNECDDTHYVSVKVHDNRIEFRVFAAVRDVRNLLWRRDLIRLIANSITDAEADCRRAALPVPKPYPAADQVLAMALDGDTPLAQHLSKVYSPAKLLALVGRAVEIHSFIERENLEVNMQLRNFQPVAEGHTYLVA